MLSSLIELLPKLPWLSILPFMVSGYKYLTEFSFNKIKKLKELEDFAKPDTSLHASILQAQYESAFVELFKIKRLNSKQMELVNLLYQTEQLSINQLRACSAYFNFESEKLTIVVKKWPIDIWVASLMVVIVSISLLPSAFSLIVPFEKTLKPEYQHMAAYLPLIGIAMLFVWLVYCVWTAAPIRNYYIAKKCAKIISDANQSPNHKIASAKKKLPIQRKTKVKSPA